MIGDDPLINLGLVVRKNWTQRIWGTRAAYIGGAGATSNVRAGKIFGIPARDACSSLLCNPMAMIMMPLWRMPRRTKTVSFSRYV